MVCKKVLAMGTHILFPNTSKQIDCKNSKLKGKYKYNSNLGPSFMCLPMKISVLHES